MNATLLKAVVLFLIVCAVCIWSFISFFRHREATSLVQLLGAGLLMITVLTHIFEALQLFPGMQWGQPNSVGHYLDFSSAVLGGILFCLALLVRAVNTYRQGKTRKLS